MLVFGGGVPSSPPRSRLSARFGNEDARPRPSPLRLSRHDGLQENKSKRARGEKGRFGVGGHERGEGAGGDVYA